MHGECSGKLSWAGLLRFVDFLLEALRMPSEASSSISRYSIEVIPSPETSTGPIVLGTDD